MVLLNNTLNPRFRELPLSHGHTTMRANGLSGTPVIVANFVSPDPRLVLADPSEDWYLNGIIVSTLRRGEIGLVVKLIPGLREHYEELGLLQRGVNLIEVPAKTVNEPGQSIYNHNATDPLGLADRTYFDGNEVLISAFSSDIINKQAAELGLATIQRPDSVLTNNKASLRSSNGVAVHKVEMTRGRVLTSFNNAGNFAFNFSGYRHGVWLKLGFGSGGDYVVHIQEEDSRDTRLLEAQIIKVRNGMRGKVQEYYAKEGFDGFELFWPERRFSPIAYPIVLETDVRSVGEVIKNGSTQMITYKSGEVDVIFHSEQITTQEGIFVGSRPLYLEEKLSNLVKAEAVKVGSYNISQGYFGIQGIDWFLVQNRISGKEEFYLTELNSRPTITNIALMVAERLGCAYWVNTNISSGRPISAIEDFHSLIGKHLTKPSENARSPQEQINAEGLVIPLAFRTLVRKDDVVPSDKMKILICGRSEAHCDDIIATMEAKGITFG